MEDIKERFIDLDIVGKSSRIRTVTSQKIILNEPFENYPTLLNENDGFYNKVYKNDLNKISPITNLLKNSNPSCHSFGVLTLSVSCDILENKIPEELKLILILKKYVEKNSLSLNISYFKNVQLYFLLDGVVTILIDEEIYSEERENGPNISAEIVHLNFKVKSFKDLVNALEVSFRLVVDGVIYLEKKLQNEQHVELLGFYKAIIDNQFMSEKLNSETVNYRRNKFLHDDKIMMSHLGLLKAKDELEDSKLLLKKVEAQNRNSKSDSSCFIVTATMNNDPNNYIVDDFRKYRDQYLKPSFTGKIFIQFYYLIGPIISLPIKYNQSLQKLSYNYFVAPIYKRIKNKV